MGYKNRVHKTGSLLFKKRRGQAASSFLNNNDLVFCTLLFAVHILDPILFKITKLPMFSKQEQWVQIDWASQPGFVAFRGAVIGKTGIINFVEYTSHVVALL